MVKELVSRHLDKADPLTTFTAALNVELYAARMCDKLFTVYKHCYDVQFVLVVTLVNRLEQLAAQSGQPNNIFQQVATRLRGTDFLRVLSMAYNSLRAAFFSQEGDWEVSWKAMCRAELESQLAALRTEFIAVMNQLGGSTPPDVAMTVDQVRTDLQKAKSSLHRLCEKLPAREAALQRYEQMQAQFQEEYQVIGDPTAAARVQSATAERAEVSAGPSEGLSEDEGEEVTGDEGEEKEEEDVDFARCAVYETEDDCLSSLDNCDWDYEAQECISGAEAYIALQEGLKREQKIK